MASSPAPPSAASSPYPFASAPDIVRAHQKDAYFTGHLANVLTDLHRRLLGARATHALGPELRSLAALLYFALTTLPGNRTLGEEYCDLIQVEAPGGSLPALKTRAKYIAGTIVLPYLVSRMLPGLRTRIRKLIKRRLSTLQQRGKDAGREARVWEYIARHLSSLTSAAPLQAVTLALFYFNGTYYELTKRLLSLRYVFTRTVPDTPDRAGYEILGVLLIVQLAVQAYLHVRSTLSSASAPRERAAFQAGTVDVSLDHTNSYSANSDLLLTELGARGPQASRVDLAATTHTPVGSTPSFNLGNDKVMGYIKGAQQRKCTLCLEELKDPAATQCGHVFCWECIGDWVREKPECPLCRREAMVQHILPLRVM
ncbi:Peroxisome biogenesis factor 10 [Tolypocladium ophioglossoides CBS 100239]|uniref:RING-type E3 ubiquitin transferase n=1 Tax=Tolypocladium ophioglossoides (strain CBS 100239) TaxID=1163406 RepID=A0A0L0NL26_TOLOC|nr:Peroxisome biogenesis factor 10 [Tolypocladium ophioglossoides CBS 100239]